MKPFNAFVYTFCFVFIAGLFYAIGYAALSGRLT